MPTALTQRRTPTRKPKDNAPNRRPPGESVRRRPAAKSAPRALPGQRVRQRKAALPARPPVAIPIHPRIISDGPPQRIRFTHTDKILFPEMGYTKGDILAYYERIAPWLLPYLRNRPVTIERLPDGLVGRNPPHFWQKNTPDYYPAWIPRVEIPTESGKPVLYPLVNDVETLLYLVNQGALTFHVFFSTIEDLSRPEFVLFDLDVGRGSFADAITVAKALHRKSEACDRGCMLKTSGKTGLHIIAPWQAGSYEESRAWAMSIARAVCAELPELATIQRIKAKRRRRIYIDVIQNALGHHAVPPYVIRATPRATVSTPLDWDELTPRLDPKRFTIKTIFDRLKR